MFEFFLALFGGLYYGGRLANEKHTMKQTNIKTQKWIDEMKRDYDQWINKVVDIKLEYEMSRRDSEAVEKMELRIRNEANITQVYDYMILMGLLAQKGKIPREIADSGVRSRGIWDYAEQQMWHEQRRFMIWYDNELRRNGLQEPLLFVDGCNENKVCHNMNLATPITNTSYMIGGRYFWAPMRFRV